MDYNLSSYWYKARYIMLLPGLLVFKHAACTDKLGMGLGMRLLASYLHETKK